MSGTGEILWENGDRYTGQLEKGELTGQGTLKKDQGDIYEGNF
jgi:hypothetical protein